MGRIHRLPPAVANQIAAGEVVERPAAVVRELVENAIDAGASAVSVLVRGAGRRVIRVSDDGSGMSLEDARLALERHATSKIESVDDLASVGSLGFRGEALPSIASVSRLRLRTRLPDEDAGWELFVEGGAPPVEAPAGMPPGTVVEVRDLFFNTPARRKFLPADRTEAAHITESVENLAACWPQVRFELRTEDRQRFLLDPVAEVAERLEQLQRRWTVDAIPVEADAGDLAVRAFLDPPMAPRGASGRLRLFVNGRPIRDRRLFSAVTEAYRRVSSLAGTPRAWVFLDVPPDLVDVNVHPAKAEVRFADAGSAWRAVFRSVLAALEGSPKQVDLGAAPPSRRPAPRPDARDRPGRLPGASGAPSGVVAGGRDLSPPDDLRRGFRDGAEAGELLYGRDAGESEASGYLDFGKSPPSVLAQFRQTYIVAEEAGALVLIDQHAADERILYNRLMEGCDQDAGVALLQPVTLELSAAEEASLDRERERLAAAGFGIEDFGGPSGARCALVRRVPEALGVGRAIDVLRRSLGADGGECLEDAAHDALARLMARVACHGAVTANTPLPPERMEAILAALWKAHNPATCPHGRPTVLRLDIPFLERRFGRR